MSALVEFLRILLEEGRVMLRDPPQPGKARDATAADLLRRAYATHRLAVAGPPIEYAEATALAAGELVRQACWFLVSHDQPAAELDRRLVMPAAPRSPADHLSADLVLRYLPQVHRRARAIDPADRLTTLLEAVLRRWPLSGVLSAVDERPEGPLDFGGHRGLQMLYAERLAQNEKPAWVPEGPGFEYVELVWADLGNDVGALVRGRQTAAAQGKLEEGDDAGE
jgi:hypothetical protein